MRILRQLGKYLSIVFAVALAAAGGVYLWGNSKSSSMLARTYETHRVEIPVPFPLSEQEIAQLRKERAAKSGSAPATAGGDSTKSKTSAAGDKNAGDDKPAPAADPLAGVDLKAIARERAIARGKHLVEARYACIECHGKDFGGGTMMDGMPVARLFGPNLTMGKGSRTRAYKVSDWDRIVRHGVLPSGRPAVMPSEDYAEMSDRELSDIIAYIRSKPPVDKPSRPRELGPLGAVLLALGKLPLSADRLPDHKAKHKRLPPRVAADKTFGKHLISICVGCHRKNLSGGPMAGGDPSWPEPKNLTTHEQGLAGWTYDDFARALRGGKRKDGTALREPMSLMVRYAKRMTETELKAMWAYIKSVKKLPTGS